MSERIENLVRELQTACEEEDFSLIVNAQAAQTPKAIIMMSGTKAELGFNLAVLEDAIENKLGLDINKLKLIGVTKAKCNCENCKSKRANDDSLLGFLEALARISKENPKEWI